jgi:hypothetical protein
MNPHLKLKSLQRKISRKYIKILSNIILCIQTQQHPKLW